MAVKKYRSMPNKVGRTTGPREVLHDICKDLTDMSEKDLDAGILCAKLLLIASFFIGISIVAMIIAFIQRLTLKLNQINLENIKLLNGMHEGVLVCSELVTQEADNTFDLLVCNKSA